MAYIYVEQVDNIAYWKKVGWAHVKEMINKKITYGELFC